MSFEHILDPCETIILVKEVGPHLMAQELVHGVKDDISLDIFASSYFEYDYHKGMVSIKDYLVVSDTPSAHIGLTSEFSQLIRQTSEKLYGKRSDMSDRSFLKNIILASQSDAIKVRSDLFSALKNSNIGDNIDSLSIYEFEPVLFYPYFPAGNLAGDLWTRVYLNEQILRKYVPHFASLLDDNSKSG